MKGLVLRWWPCIPEKDRQGEGITIPSRFIQWRSLFLSQHEKLGWFLAWLYNPRYWYLFLVDIHQDFNLQLKPAAGRTPSASAVLGEMEFEGNTRIWKNCTSSLPFSSLPFSFFFFFSSLLSSFFPSFPFLSFPLSSLLFSILFLSCPLSFVSSFLFPFHFWWLASSVSFQNDYDFE